MSFFVLVNITLRALLTLCTIYCIVKFGPRLNFLERLGAGLVGGSSLLTIPLIIDVYKRGTPFDGWATSVLTVGCIVGFCGLMTRLRRHEARNEAMIDQARQHLEGKRK